MRLQSAIFDMDGTLIDSMQMWKELGFYLLRRHNVQPPADLAEHLKPMGLRDGVAFCRDYCGLPGTVDELIAEAQERVEDFYRNEVQAKPGVKETLSLLKMEGVWMYIATATDRTLAEIALRHAGLDGYFRGIVTSREAGQHKKDGPAVYERALTRLRSTKKDTVVFEDAIHAIRTAKAAGFRVAAIYDPVAEDDQEEIRSLADYYYRSFEELYQAKTLV